MNYFGIEIGSPAIVRKQKRTHFHHDTETFCEVDLPKVGASIYTKHPSFELLMCAWSWGDENDIKQWAPVEIGETMPAEVEDALLDERVVKVAWNKSFEYNVWKNGFGIDVPHRQWRDPMVLAYTLSFPGKLEKVGPILGLSEDKLKDRRGALLLRKFCMPRKPTKTKLWTRSDWLTDPKDWRDFLFYNRQDVVSEIAAWRRMIPYDLPAHEWELWFEDQEINEAGIPINLDMVRNALRIYNDVVHKRLRSMVDITGLDNPNSNAQLLEWLQGEGYVFDDLKKGHVRRAIEACREDIRQGDTAESTQRLLDVLELRAEVSKTSIKKYEAMLDVVADEDRVFRYAFQFAGAGRTWRWSGRKVQYHNAPRPPSYLEKVQEQVAQHIECLEPAEFEDLYSAREELVTPTGRIVRRKSLVMDALATGIRPAVQAPDGYIFVDADLNAIENRVLGYMAQDPKILNVFRNDLDPYIDFATYMLGGTYEQRWKEYKDGNKEPRTLAKPGVLGCGYMLSAGTIYENKQTGEMEATGLLGYAWNMGVTQFTLEQSERAVKVWRETFEDCVEFWYRIEKAARKCIRTGEETECWPVRFDRKGPFLRMILPSGRALHYCRPRIEDCKMPWGAIKPAITYENLNDKNQWERIQTHPGKITENADQAISRDLLAHGIHLARAEGLDVRLHVHDQILAMIPERQANWGIATLLDCMKMPPKWAPDIPLGAAGSVSKYFVKD